MPRYFALCMSLHAIALLGTTSSAEDANSPLQITLSTPKSDYVVGEPIVLNVSVTNTGQGVAKLSDITAHDHPYCPEFGIYIAPAGQNFKKYLPTCIQARRTRRETIELKPNKSLDYHLRILVTGLRPIELAISEPGRYRLKVEHPHYPAIEIDPIDVRVAEPKEADTEIRKAMQSPEFLYFFHWGEAMSKSKAAPLLAAELLKSHPQSAYRDAIRWALGEYYRSGPSLSEHEKELIREVAGAQAKQMERVREGAGDAAFAPHPLETDDRLDRVVTYHFPDEVPLGEAVQKLSRQSRVPLDMHPEVRGWGMRSARVTKPLREFMELIAAGGVEWFRKGDGYLLAPENWNGDLEKQD